VAAKQPKAKHRAGLSALDAAAKVLEDLKGSDAKAGMQAQDLIDRMRSTRLWASPSGKTPSATLYAAMVREITLKKGESRFVRVSPGHFAINAGKTPRKGGGE